MNFSKTTSFLLSACFILGTAQSSFALSTAPATKEVAIGLNDVYVPGGFDSKADSYVIANGLFPNGCYKWDRADVKHVSTFEHEVQPYAIVSQGMCIMVLVPFSKEIRMGKLATGTHLLKFLNGDGTYLQKSMSVE